MGIRFHCPNGHKLNVKAALAGKIGVCPDCGERMLIPFQSTRESSHKRHAEKNGSAIPEPDEISPEIHQATPGDGPPLPVPARTSGSGGTSAPISPEPTPGLGMGNEKTAPHEALTDRHAAEASDLGHDLDTNPLLTDPNLVWYVRSEENQSFGPVTNIIMKGWLREKRISPDMLVWREGWSSWLVAKNVFPELETIFASSLENSTPGLSERLPSHSEDHAGETSKQEGRKKAARQRKRQNELRDLILVIGLIVVIIVLIAILVLILVNSSQTPARAASGLTYSAHGAEMDSAWFAEQVSAMRR